MKPSALLVLVLGACGGDGGTKMPDAPTVPATITVSGTASERSLSGTTAVAGATVAAYSNSAPSTIVAMTTTDAMGNYSLPIPTMGKPIDGFLKGTKNGYIDTYLYAPAPLVADFHMAALNMLTPNEFSLLSGTLCGVTQDSAKGTVALEVIDTAMATVGGATVSTSPAASKYCYDSGGFPNKSATMTDTDGVAIAFNVTGTVMVSAAKSGATFQTHAVNAVAGAFTTTLVSE